MDDPLIYVAFGDSITNGNNVRKKHRYPSILTEMMEQHLHRPVYGKNMGKNGMSSSGLLKMLQIPHVLSIVHHAHFVTVCIGGNDLIYTYMKWRIWRNRTRLDKGIEQFGHNFHNICHLLAVSSPGRVVLSTFYNPFPHTSLAVDVVEFCNDGIIRPTAQQYGFPVVDLYAAFRGREPLLLEHYRSGHLEAYRPFTHHSPIHPNAHGYHVIAHLFNSALLM